MQTARCVVQDLFVRFEEPMLVVVVVVVAGCGMIEIRECGAFSSTTGVYAGVQFLKGRTCMHPSSSSLLVVLVVIALKEVVEIVL